MAALGKAWVMNGISGLCGIALVVAASFPAAAASPSFDCQKVKQPDLVAICGNDRLARADVMTTEMFQKAKSANRAVAVAAARSFLRSRKQCASDETCILVTQTQALAIFGQITGDIPSGADRDTKNEYARDGYLVSKFSDGTGAVSIGRDYRGDTWSYDCRIDAMTDQRKCRISTKTGGPLIFYGEKKQPISVCIIGHDFPGRQGMVRIDSNQAVTTNDDGCYFAESILPQMKNGHTITTRSYRWPYDWPVDTKMSLGGLVQALATVDEVLAGNVQ